MVYDNRRLLSKRNYLKCVLCSQDLFNEGIAEFDSKKSATWFAYLLRFRRLPPPSMTAKALREQVGEVDESDLPLVLRTARCPPQAIAEAAPAICDNEDDPDIAGDDVPQQAVGIQEPLPPGPAPEDEGEGEVAGDEPNAAAGLSWPDRLEGAKLSKIAGRSDGTYFYYNRLSVVWTNPDHGHRCRKSRSVMKGADTFGPRVALYFLGAWLRASDRPEEEHRKYEPSVAEMRAYRDSQ